MLVQIFSIDTKPSSQDIEQDGMKTPSGFLHIGPMAKVVYIDVGLGRTISSPAGSKSKLIGPMPGILPYGSSFL